MHIGRTRFKKDIITEFMLPQRKDSRKVMIFCSGVPGSPHKDEVLDFWARKGYWTFFPRYRGTWESGGSFLAHSPHKDLLDVIDGLSSKEKFHDFWGGKNHQIKPKKIVIVGSSFGGPAAILASRDPRVDKVVCISPVVDWVAENKADPLDKLYTFLKDAYGGAYRIQKKDWNKLAQGRFYNPVQHLQELDGRKILILHAKDDEIVKAKPVIKFAQQTQSQLVLLNKGGHLSSSMLTLDRYYRKVISFLK
ncbi:MAG: prolyl oligopeptidase family serine peptidase [Candidatus Omnitrophica bacterium]|nr:prolyl oligopeptidase family serine peptidase [Candidatus Omnitrophota bacterium]MCB9747825.1 prolyl oligopeptidase family serine peptidase [Candidatus Omnitrophota bacterium]